MTAMIQRVEPQTAGTHFIQPAPDHTCKASCYRTRHSAKSDDHRIITICDAGHIVSSYDTGQGSHFAGSAFEASLNSLPVFAPFVIVES